MRLSLATVGNGLVRPSLLEEFFNVSPVDYCMKDVYLNVNLKEDEKAVYVTAEIPGMEEKDLNIMLKDTMLTISGEKKEEKTEGGKNANYWYCERAFGSFSRTLSLPEGIKSDDVKATYRNGVLEIVLQKAEAAQPRKITVKAN